MDLDQRKLDDLHERTIAQVYSIQRQAIQWLKYVRQHPTGDTREARICALPRLSTPRWTPGHNTSLTDLPRWNVGPFPTSYAFQWRGEKGQTTYAAAIIEVELEYRAALSALIKEAKKAEQARADRRRIRWFD